MRITGLHIDGFGRFADRRFGPLERPVTVFYGPNEAGKSTLLEFIRRDPVRVPQRPQPGQRVSAPGRRATRRPRDHRHGRRGSHHH